jgi:hypothetical protein
MSAAAIIAIRRKRLVRRFREAGALDLEHAVTLEVLGERHSWIFEQMARRGVFLQAGEGRYFMDERAGLEFLRQARRRALIIGGGFLLFFLVFWLASWALR